MKDALGHGSNGSGDGTLLEALRARLPHSSLLRGGGIPSASSKAAVVSNKPPAPVINAPSQRWNPDRSAEQEYNRNLVLRVRNGEVGRKGM